jgi:hypothetical protein
VPPVSVIVPNSPSRIRSHESESCPGPPRIRPRLNFQLPPAISWSSPTDWSTFFSVRSNATESWIYIPIVCFIINRDNTCTSRNLPPWNIIFDHLSTLWNSYDFSVIEIDFIINDISLNLHTFHDALNSLRIIYERSFSVADLHVLQTHPHFWNSNGYLKDYHQEFV